MSSHITDFASLKEAIVIEADREGHTTFENRTEQFIANAEERIFKGVGRYDDPLYSEPLRASEMVTSTTVALTSGTGSLPADCLSVRRLTRDSDRHGLKYLAPEALALDIACQSGTGNPIWFTIEGTSILTSPTGFTGNLNIVYYAQPDALSSDNTTNVVLTARPSLYQQASLYYAFKWARDYDAAQTALAELRAIISGANHTEAHQRHAGGKLISKPRVVVGC